VFNNPSLAPIEAVYTTPQHLPNMDHRPALSASAPAPAPAPIEPPTYLWSESVMSTRSLSYISVADAALGTQSRQSSYTNLRRIPTRQNTLDPMDEEPEPELYTLPKSLEEPPAKLFAIADVHVSYRSNRQAFQSLSPRPDDGLILAGDGMSISSSYCFQQKVATDTPTQSAKQSNNSTKPSPSPLIPSKPSFGFPATTNFTPPNRPKKLRCT
jgi:hypothetical protein